MHALRPGDWYLLFTCRQCRKRQVLFPDLSRGSAKIEFAYSARCAECGHTASYENENLETYLHPLDCSQGALLPRIL
jgi:ribosomal protein S27E